MKKRFPVLREKPIFAVNLAEILTETTIHFFLIDELQFSNIVLFNYVTTEIN